MPLKLRRKLQLYPGFQPKIKGNLVSWGSFVVSFYVVKPFNERQRIMSPVCQEEERAKRTILRRNFLIGGIELLIEGFQLEECAKNLPGRWRK